MNDFDAHSSLAVSMVTSVVSDNGSILVVGIVAGAGALFSPPQQITVGPSNQSITINNGMIARLISITGDTLTIDYTQENREETAIRKVQIGDQIGNGVTPKAFTDIENGRFLSPYTDFGTVAGFDPAGLTQANWHAQVSLTGSPQTISSGFSNPSQPRSVYINNSLNDGTYIIHGTDVSDNALSETVNLNMGQVETTKAFKTITSVDCPASIGSVVDFSTGAKIGLTSLHTGPIIGVPITDGVCRITFNDLEEGWAMTGNGDASIIASNYIPLGEWFVATGDFAFYYITN